MTAEVVGLLAWPAVAVIGLLIFFARCGGAINRFIDRVTSLKSGDNVAEASPAPQLAQVEPNEREANVAPLVAAQHAANIELRPGYPSWVYERSREDIPDNEMRIRFLSNLCGIEYDQRQFERFYRLAFGSQLYLLDKLNERGFIPKSEVQLYYERERERLGLDNVIFDNWLQYMSSFDLISVSPENIEITQRGREFLVYAMTAHLSLHKEH